LFLIPNADKQFHEKWYEGRNMLNFPHPVRGVFMGPPNCGKSFSIKHILLRADPPFEEVIVIHCDAEYTKEWDDIECELISEIPSPSEWQGLVKTLVVLDDIDYKSLNKSQKSNLDRLVGNVSTHKNISVCITAQCPFNIPPIVRRCANLWVLWRSPDMDAMSVVARKTGMKSDEMLKIFEDILPEKTDGLWLDLTSKTKYPVRKNGFTVISK
jgi:hypothetical protein